MRDKLEFDEAEYYDLAGQLIHGQYEFGPRRVIGHPAALALMRLGLGDQIFRVQLCVSLIFSLTAPLTYLPIAGGLNPQLVLMNADDERRTRMATPGGRITWVGPGKWLPPSQTGYLSTEELALPYSQMSSLLTKRSLAWIVTNPCDACFVTWRKLAHMWAIYPFWNGLSQTLLGNVPTVGLLILSFVGLVSLSA
jgi:hypothetical protein